MAWEGWRKRKIRNGGERYFLAPADDLYLTEWRLHHSFTMEIAYN